MSCNELTRRGLFFAGAATLPQFLTRAASPRQARRIGRLIAVRDHPFHLRVHQGAVWSLRNAADTFDTDYIRAETALGAVQTRYGDVNSWRGLDTNAGSIIETATSTGRVVVADGLSLSSTITAVGQQLRWTITVTNKGSAVKEVGDIILPLPMNTTFAAGRPPTEAVMKHSFVSGHGSHVFWMRPNSAGPYLLMLPERNTHLEYWEPRPQKGGGECWCAFVHAGATVTERKKSGATWRLPTSTLRLAPGDLRTFSFNFSWVDDYQAARAAITAAGLVDVEVVPGMTIPAGFHADIALASADLVHAVTAEYPDATVIERLPDRGGRQLWRIRFERLGENLVTLHQADGRATYLEFFATEPLDTMVRKRAAFIAAHQHRDPSKWYDGLLGEWNMDSRTLLGPDNYDRISGWRIYEVTCDDPGLSKPAFLASKNAQLPDQSEVVALDHYIEKFVWGGLQMTTAERYPYAIYGILDWKRNRTSADPGDKGRLHVWRPYDYPHVFTMYHAMHRVARDHPGIKTKLSPRDYLVRAHGTAMAMFTVPKAVVGWSAEETGFYNECVVPEIVADLRLAGMPAEGDALEARWFAKVRRFVAGTVDLFGSEYPFDSTGFESTAALARSALDAPLRAGVTKAAASAFAAKQIAANIFCRGWLEPAYYLLGSDYRAGGGDGYTLSYMAQMGGGGVLDHALYDAKDPFPLLRLAYASQLSSWALLNSGTAQSNYGYWFPGKANDGAAGGGFEPASHGHTWLEQPHHRGSWYYSCEIDLGFCGALRAAATIVADDPIFGRICYGGTIEERRDGKLWVHPADGVRRRLHARLGTMTADLRLLDARFDKSSAIELSPTSHWVRFLPEPFGADHSRIRIAIRSDSVWHERVIDVDRSGWAVVDFSAARTTMAFDGRRVDEKQERTGRADK